jgi:hypothetical protein
MSRKHRHKQRNRDKDVVYNFYYGIPHSHTSYSTGKGSPKDALAYAKSKGIHFLAITDHNKHLDGTVKYKGEHIQKWTATEKTIKYFNRKNKYFLGLRGFEIKVKSVGEINIINSKKHLKGSIRDLKTLQSIFQEGDCIGIINHPGSAIERLRYLLELNDYISLVEVGNGSPPFKYNRYMKQYYKLLDAGWKLGAVNGQDNHLDNWGDTNNLTVVLCEKLTTANLMEGLKRRRTYSTESRSLKLMYKINNVWMGETIKVVESEELHIQVFVEDYDFEIEKVEVLTNGGRVIKDFFMPSDIRFKCDFTVTASSSETWYVVKITQSGNKISISSPVFIQIK